ncbi:WhiB family transcriptional regulator [Actinacidiphila rubida]|uniref:WhiB family transcriptional regulator n=1 Tax=Actinacidiphila rubida TaxID=310780 RepID=UPI000943804A|nr:WhiB family transcriptional regulator [Actinacidiphila rubida]
MKPPSTKPLLSEWEWQSAASCRGMDSSVFFSPPDERRSERRKREARAQAICRTCPVRRTCASFAVRTGQAYGVWGSLTEADRRAR